MNVVCIGVVNSSVVALTYFEQIHTCILGLHTPYRHEQLFSTISMINSELGKINCSKGYDKMCVKSSPWVKTQNKTK